MNLNELTIKEARSLLDEGKTSSVEITKACLEQIKKYDPEIGACLLVCEKEALEEAAKADKRIASGEKSELLGIPYLCKDNIMVKGWKITAASLMLKDYIAPYDATVIKKLKAAGAVLLGKTNLDEFAHGASTENSAFKTTKNPLDINRVPGGSSGGSAAAVASHMCLFALGSDTGGSIRQPASFCGLNGLKPSYGRVSRFGLLSMTSSTDVIGPIAKNVYDLAMVLEVISGHDKLDATTTNKFLGFYSQELEASKPIRIGLPKQYFIEGLDPRIKDGILSITKKLEKEGFEVKEVDLPYTKYSVPAYYLITSAEISSNLARFDGLGWGFSVPESDNLDDFYKKNRGLSFGPEVKRRVMLGTYSLSAGYFDSYYKKAQAVRGLIKADFNKAFKNVDVIIAPTSPHLAFKINQQNNNPLEMYLEDIYLSATSLAGLPAISMPGQKAIGLEEEGLNYKKEKVTALDFGMQLIGDKLGEESILKLALKIEGLK